MLCKVGRRQLKFAYQVPVILAKKKIAYTDRALDTSLAILCILPL